MVAVYAWVNKITNQRYIGGSTNVHRRKNTHLRKLRSNTHENIKLQRAWNKYGEHNFEFVILEKPQAENLLMCEQKWLNRYFGSECYNICHIAGSPSAINRKKTDDHRKKISKSVKEFYDKNPTHKKFLSDLKKGSVLPESTKQKMRDAKKRGSEHHNSILTEEDVRNIRQKYIPYEYGFGKLSSEYGVDRKTIIRIIQNKTWTHIK
jgi:group I intron endonuclease